MSVDDKTRDELDRMRRAGGSLFGRGGGEDGDDKQVLRERQRPDWKTITGMIGNPSRDAPPIDAHASVSKQAVQALRYLFQAGKLTRKDKEVLLLDIIDHVVREQGSVVVVAFELLVLQARQPGRDRRSQGRAVSSTGLEEFAEQCKLLVAEIQAGNGRDDAFDDDDEDDEEEEENEEEEVDFDVDGAYDDEVEEEEEEEGGVKRR